METERGIFIAFEGLDGCGKSTLIDMFAELLRKEGNKVFITREPFDTPIGNLLRDYLAKGFGERVSDAVGNRVLTCLFAADRQLHGEIIKQKIEEGYIVLCDRYLYSSLAYQKDYSYTLETNKDYFPTDYVVFIDDSVDNCLSRVLNRSNGVEIFEKKEELDRIKKNYDKKILPYIPPTKLIKIAGGRDLDSMLKDLDFALFI